VGLREVSDGREGQSGKLGLGKPNLAQKIVIIFVLILKGQGKWCPIVRIMEYFTRKRIYINVNRYNSWYELELVFFGIKFLKKLLNPNFPFSPESTKKTKFGYKMVIVVSSSQYTSFTFSNFNTCPISTPILDHPQ
jgi:hypothetical protein